MNPNDRKHRIASLERRLAVMTHWGLAGSFGMAFLLSGFNASDWTCGLLGYALLIGGFVGHVLINHYFDSGFNAGEVALGLILFGLFALKIYNNLEMINHFEAYLKKNIFFIF